MNWFPEQERLPDNAPVVLVIDDDQSVCDCLSDIFRQQRYATLVAWSGREALVLAEQHRLDAVFAARQLPDGSGIDLLKKIKRRHPDVYTAVIGAGIGEDEVVPAGVDDCFVRPLQRDKVLASLSKELENRQMRRALEESEEELLRNFQTAQVINALLHIALQDLSLTEMLQATLDHLLSLPWLAFKRRGAIFLADRRTNDLVMTVQHGLAEPLRNSCRRLPPGRCLCGLAAQQKKIVFADCVDERHQITYAGITPHGHYIVPVLLRNRVLGVINIYTEEKHRRSTAEEQFLATVADTVAAMISRYRVEEEKKKLEANLRQSQKMQAIGTLAGGIAHDFNNILTSILGYASLVREQCPEASQITADVDQIIAAGQRARQLVRQILTFSRQREGNRQVIQAELLVKEALKLLRASIPSTIEIRQRVEPDCMVVADPALIHQVVMNLCTNAFHAMRSGGGVLDVGLDRVTIKDGRPGVIGRLSAGQYVRLRVRDTGCGIPPEIMERIFEPYFTTRKAEDGTGLGLAVVYGIVSDLGGDIFVESGGGEGTVFEIFLPLAREKGVEPPGNGVDVDLPRGTERILCVDDEQPIVELCRRSLEFLGYTVTVRTSSVDALELFRVRAQDFELVLTDQTMPNMTGMALAREIHRIRADIPVILATGYSDLVGSNLREQGINALLAKPLVRRDLARVVREVLDEGKL